MSFCSILNFEVATKLAESNRLSILSDKLNHTGYLNKNTSRCDEVSNTILSQSSGRIELILFFLKHRFGVQEHGIVPWYYRGGVRRRRQNGGGPYHDLEVENFL